MIPLGDPLNYLLELGFTLDEVETLKSRNDFTCQQMADAAKAIVDRGGNPLEAFGPRATGWEKPIPFDEIQTPDFPVEALPGPLGAFVECLAESTQTPEEMGGTLSLGVLATAFQRRYEVEVTRDWREPLCLYSSAVAPPGERKSAVISALNKPIYEYEAEVRAAEAAEIAQNQGGSTHNEAVISSKIILPGLLDRHYFYLVFTKLFLYFLCHPTRSFGFGSIKQTYLFHNSYLLIFQ